MERIARVATVAQQARNAAAAAAPAAGPSKLQSALQQLAARERIRSDAA
jgi:hypothetical protein